MLFGDLVTGRFVRRDNRFRASVAVDDRLVAVHVPNSGRLGELLLPDRQVWLSPARSNHRKTAYTLALVAHGGQIVSVDATLPNDLYEEALGAGGVFGSGYQHIKREVTHGASRFDFRLTGLKGACWIEVKSVTLVEGHVALFPDAPTQRGRKHVEELASIARQGGCAGVAFVVQRDDARVFAPHVAADPELSEALQLAAATGVQIRAYACRVSAQEITIERRIPIDWP